MKVTWSMAGGIGGFSPPAKTIDLSKLPPDVAARVEAALLPLAEEEHQSYQSRNVGDGMKVTIAVDRKADSRFTVSQFDTDMTPEFARALDALSRLPSP
jgi:hypothetical protein